MRGDRPAAGGAITLTCQACGEGWDRVPKPSCPRCGKSDVEEYGRDDWAFDDPAAGRHDPAAAGHFLGGSTLRCRKCHHTWGQAR